MRNSGSETTITDPRLDIIPPAPWTPVHATPTKAPLRWRRKRLIYVLLALVGLYLILFRNSAASSNGFGFNGKRHVIGGLDFGRSQDEGRHGPASQTAPKGPPPRTDSRSNLKTSLQGSGQLSGDEEHYYSGPIRFYDLKTSLDTIDRTGGHRETNRNVLFAASSLRSVANLLPLVCEMAKMGKNHVHLIVLGRAALYIDDILKINGVDKKTCKAWFHDGRPDYSEYSTDIRAEASVVGAMYHVNSWMHPQVVIVDDEYIEDGFFIRGIRGKMRDLNRPIIELPSGRYNDFRWMTRLSSASLSSWHKPRLEILVHTPPNAGGGLARLLKGLSTTDFGGFRKPKLTIELPAQTDGNLTSFLNDFVWPPGLKDTGTDSDMLKIQKRIPSAHMSSEERSVRFVESYYPSHTHEDHVLILSPNMELSPSFFHYLMYTLLQSCYSTFGAEQREHLAGLTLASPSTLLDGTTKFKPPARNDVVKSSSDKTSSNDDDTTASFLWQAPSSDAVLVFGDRWAEFHDYLSEQTAQPS